jgi:hypothetical protein
MTAFGCVTSSLRWLGTGVGVAVDIREIRPDFNPLYDSGRDALRAMKR